MATRTTCDKCDKEISIVHRVVLPIKRDIDLCKECFMGLETYLKKEHQELDFPIKGGIINR